MRCEPVTQWIDFGYLSPSAQVFDPHLSIFLKPEMITIGDGARLDGMIKLEGGQGITILGGVHISSLTHINIGGGRTIIEANAAITSGAAILSGTNTMAGEAMSSAAPQEMQVIERKVTHIGECAFIGSHAVVYPGVTVGHHAVIKAGSVVTKDVLPYAIVAGVPAKIVGWRQWQEDSQTFKAVYLAKVAEQLAELMEASYP